MMRQRLAMRPTIGAVAVALCASLTACGGGASGDDGSAATTEQPPTTEAPATTTTVDPQAQALADAEAAYLAYEEASNVAAADPVDPQHPDLQALITGDQRLHSNSELGEFLARGEAVRFADPSQYRVDVLSSALQSDGSILLRVCRADDRVVYDVATDEVVDDDVVTRTIEAVMVNESGGWKLSRSVSVAHVSGVASCAE